MKSKRKLAHLFLDRIESTGGKISLFDRDLVVVSDNFSQQDWDELDELREELVEILLQREVPDS